MRGLLGRVAIRLDVVARRVHALDGVAPSDHAGRGRGRHPIDVHRQPAAGAIRRQHVLERDCLLSCCIEIQNWVAIAGVLRRKVRRRRNPGRAVRLPQLTLDYTE
jgi:hypothetical protein